MLLLRPSPPCTLIRTSRSIHTHLISQLLLFHMPSVDSLLNDIVSSFGLTKTSTDDVQNKFISEAKDLYPTMIKDLMAKSGISELENMSLLSLKNEALLSYVNNIVLIMLAHLERISEDADESSVESLKRRAVERTVEQRTCLEKGVKPLERKLTYQLDKMVRSFHKMEEDNAKMESKINKQVEEGEADSESEEEKPENGDAEDSEEEDDDALAYKPDAAALALLAKKPRRPEAKGAREEKYRPPKISAAAPPTAQFDDKATRQKSNRKLHSMEEFLQENSDMPQAESSIGATILGHGRGGVKTSRDRQKEREIQRYEETNFTRLPSTANKKSFKQKMAERANTFAGEDWSMFNNSRSIRDDTSRKRKAGSSWDRLKKKRT